MYKASYTTARRIITSNTHTIVTPKQFGSKLPFFSIIFH